MENLKRGCLKLFEWLKQHEGSTVRVTCKFPGQYGGPDSTRWRVTPAKVFSIKEKLNYKYEISFDDLEKSLVLPADTYSKAKQSSKKIIYEKHYDNAPHPGVNRRDKPGGSYLVVWTFELY